MGIFAEDLWTELNCQTTVELSKTAIFSNFVDYSFGNFGDEASFII